MTRISHLTRLQHRPDVHDCPRRPRPAPRVPWPPPNFLGPGSTLRPKDSCGQSLCVDPRFSNLKAALLSTGILSLVSVYENNASRVKIGIALRKKAGWVLERLTLSNQLGTPFAEETITETLLLDLRDELGSLLTVESFSKYVEGTETGADWEWWFCDGIGSPLYGMRVQAKKLKSQRGRPFYDLGYKGQNSPKRQVDLLCEAAAAGTRPLTPVYVLYNGPDLDLDLFPWNCCREPRSPSVFGVSMLSGLTAQALADAGQTALSEVGPFCLPWSCCALCPTSLSLGAFSDLVPPDSPLASGVGELAYYAGDLATALLLRDSGQIGQRPGVRAQQAIDAFHFWEEAPAYVRQAVEQIGRLPESVTPEETQPVLPRGLAGFTVWTAG